MIKNVFITGGAGYVGSVLTNYLLKKNFNVTVYDLFMYGNLFRENKNLKNVKGDIRDIKLMAKYLKGQDAVIHLACISNDPSFELNPKLGKEINFNAFEPLVKESRDIGVKKFIYASSSSVYGIKKEVNVNEEIPLEPLTDYSKFKALCEDILLKYSSKNFCCTILRPATVCGYSPRQRFDLVVNILTNQAVNLKKIKIFGGNQLRPNININDMVEAYYQLLKLPANKISNKIYNLGIQNQSVSSLAKTVKNVVANNIELITVPSDDIRSYHISSEKIKKELGFVPKFTVEDAVHDLCNSFEKNKFSNSLNNELYFNIKRMNSLQLK